MSAAPGAVVLAMSALFLAAVVHKLRALLHGRSAAQPLIAVDAGRVRHAEQLVGAVAAIELAVVALLLVLPTAGLLAASALLLAYVNLLRRLPPDASCQCLGTALGGSARSAVRRNLVLAAVALALGGAVLSGAATPAPLTDQALGIALVLVAGAAAAAAFSHSMARASDRAPVLQSADDR